MTERKGTTVTDTDQRRPRGAHLVGSVPLPTAEDVLRAAATRAGAQLRRIPDGEVGERLGWIGFQVGRLGASPQMELVPPDPDHYAPLPVVRRRAGVADAEIGFSDLGYAEAARSSYATFARLREEGVIAAGVRFQVSLPTPLASVASFVAPADQAAVEPAYERAMLAELDAILGEIPHADLAIQWDVAVEFGILEGVWPAPFDDVEDGIVARLVRLGNAVPIDVELGYHLCYGDYGHRHFVEPADTSTLVRIANRVAAETGRPIAWFHLPVPRERDDEGYFAPLADLRLSPETELYLGLLHATDGVEGAERRIAAARRAAPAFGVATECGFGRRPAETIGPLLDLHAATADPVTPA